MKEIVHTIGGILILTVGLCAIISFSIFTAECFDREYKIGTGNAKYVFCAVGTACFVLGVGMLSIAQNHL